VSKSKKLYQQKYRVIFSSCKEKQPKTYQNQFPDTKIGTRPAHLEIGLEILELHFKGIHRGSFSGHLCACCEKGLMIEY
jgi:hypothetical protein